MGDISELSDSEMSAIAQFSEDEVLRLFNRFVSLDTDGSGQLEPGEILGVKDVANNPVARRVIELLDLNRNNRLSFLEFLVGVAKLTTATDPEARVKFFFDLYDVNGDGFISNGDLFRTLKLMVGDEITQEQLQQLVDRTMRDTDLDLDGALSLSEFKNAVAKIRLDDKLTVEF